jgi:hypothetical protein
MVACHVPGTADRLRIALSDSSSPTRTRPSDIGVQRAVAHLRFAPSWPTAEGYWYLHAQHRSVKQPVRPFSPGDIGDHGWSVCSQEIDFPYAERF